MNDQEKAEFLLMLRGDPEAPKPKGVIDGKRAKESAKDGGYILFGDLAEILPAAIRNLTPEQAKAIRLKREKDLAMANAALARFWHWRQAVKARIRPKWLVD